MTIEILLSCMHQKDTSIVSRSNIQTDVVVVNQCDNESVINKTFINKQGDECHIKFISTTERGLSRSRNMAIKHSTVDICVISDDDEQFENNAYEDIINSFKQHLEADIITFNVEGSHSFKKESMRTEGRVGFMKAMQTSSVQIAFRRNSVLKANVRFDEEMGSGTGNGGGEEIKFLFECLRKGLRIYHIPIKIASLKQDSTSIWFKGYTSNYFVQRGWTTRRYMGIFFSTLYSVYYALRKYSKYKKEIGFWKVLYYTQVGIHK